MIEYNCVRFGELQEFDPGVVIDVAPCGVDLTNAYYRTVLKLSTRLLKLVLEFSSFWVG